MNNRMIIALSGFAAIVATLVLARSPSSVADALTPPVPSLADVVSGIGLEEAAHLAASGKYRQLPKTAEGSYEVEVHEYVTPNGTPGYQVFTTEFTDGKPVRVTSQGFGPEAVARTFEQVFPTDSASATSTPARAPSAPAEPLTPSPAPLPSEAAATATPATTP